jgi:hypothetical protein
MSEKIQKNAKDKPRKETADNTPSQRKSYIAASPKTKAVEVILIAGGGITAATSGTVLSLPILQAVTPLSIGIWIVLFFVGTFAVLVGLTLTWMVATKSEKDDLHIFTPPKPKRTRRPRQNTELKEIKKLLEAKTQANVTLESNHLTLNPGQSPRVALNLLNSGGEDAYDFEIKSFYAYLPLDFSERLNGKLVGVPDSEVDIPKINGKIGTFLSWDKILSFGDIVVIKASKALLFFYIEASFKNRIGVRIPAFKHCYVYDADLNDLVIAPKKYWPLSAITET